MKKHEFICEICEILEIENDGVDFDTFISLDSLSTLSMISFLDDKFQKKSTASDLGNVRRVADIVKLIGEERIA
jgi:acyl carrier protein